MRTVPKLAVTGTKGKTTVVNVVADVLQRLNCDVLKVTTDGHYVNGRQRSTLTDSTKLWGLVPTVCPGRYLWEFKTDKVLSHSLRPVAVLEAALGSSATAGLGYRYHDVGVFLNVMEDHIGSSARLQTQADIAKAKSFIYRRIKQSGYLVFNADDPYVVETLKAVPAKREAKLIACGLSFDNFDIKKHLSQGGVVLTVEDGQAVLLKGRTRKPLFNLKAIPWTFQATFQPSIYNLLHAAGVIYGYYDGSLPKNFKTIVEAVRLDPYGGRLTLLKARNGATILADYAHEKNSLAQVGDLARSLTKDHGKVIGVVRLAYDRTPALIHETGQHIASHFDEFIVYDKIDGYWTSGSFQKGRRFQKVEGQVSKLLADAIASENPKVTRIVREDQALDKAAESAGPDDAVVFIANSDVKQSIKFAQASFGARFM